MFGLSAFYRAGELVLVLTGEGDEPWNGVMVATDRTRHAALVAEWPVLAPHVVLGKWLYLSCEHADFERVAEALVGLVADRDSRLGVVPKPKRPRRSKGLAAPAGGRRKGLD